VPSKLGNFIILHIGCLHLAGTVFSSHIRQGIHPEINELYWKNIELHVEQLSKNSGLIMSEQQETPSQAETGVYIDKIQIFEPTGTDRFLYAKGHEIVVFHPKDKKKQWRYRPEKDEKISVPAGYAVRAVRTWLLWAQ